MQIVQELKKKKVWKMSLLSLTEEGNKKMTRCFNKSVTSETRGWVTPVYNKEKKKTLYYFFSRQKEKEDEDDCRNTRRGRKREMNERRFEKMKGRWEIFEVTGFWFDCI